MFPEYWLMENKLERGIEEINYQLPRSYVNAILYWFTRCIEGSASSILARFLSFLFVFFRPCWKMCLKYFLSSNPIPQSPFPGSDPNHEYPISLSPIFKDTVF